MLPHSLIAEASKVPEVLAHFFSSQVVLSYPSLLHVSEQQYSIPLLAEAIPPRPKTNHERQTTSLSP